MEKPSLGNPQVSGGRQASRTWKQTGFGHGRVRDIDGCQAAAGEVKLRYPLAIEHGFYHDSPIGYVTYANLEKGFSRIFAAMFDYRTSASSASHQLCLLHLGLSKLQDLMPGASGWFTLDGWEGILGLAWVWLQIGDAQRCIID